MSEETTTAMTVPNYNLPATQDDDAFDAVASGNDFLPRIQLMTSRSVKVESGEFEKNHFAFIAGGNFIDIGENVDVLVLAWRLKAIDMSGDDIITCYDPKFENKKATGLFAEIMDKAGEKDSGCMFGPEFLLYVPKVKKFGTLLFGSITMRNEAPSMKAKMGKAATLYPRQITTKGKKSYTYFSASIKDCTSAFECPSVDKVNEEVEKFNNPPSDTVEAASEQEAAATTRAQ